MDGETKVFGQDEPDVERVVDLVLEICSWVLSQNEADHWGPGLIWSLLGEGGMGWSRKKDDFF